MSPAGWERRLAKRGLKLILSDAPGDYAADKGWLAVIEPAAPNRPDPRFRPLIGIGDHASRDAAITLALADFEEKREDQERERAVLALAGELALEEEQKSLESWRKLVAGVVSRTFPAPTPPLTPTEVATLDRRLVPDGLDGPHTRALRSLRRLLGG